MEYKERLYNELITEVGLIWYVYTEHATKIMVKSSTIAIKSILKGCEVKLLFGKDSNSAEFFFHTGITIYDIPTNGFTIIKTHRFIEDHISLYKVMKQDKTYVEFYNELNICCMYGYLTLKAADRKNVLSLIANTEQLYSGCFNDKVKQSLDCFEYSLDNSSEILNPRLINTLKISIAFSGLTTLITDFIELNNCNELILDDLDEGDYFEKQIWALFNNILPFNTYKNPRFIRNSKTRELTDILAYYHSGIFLVETKAMAVLSIDNNQSIERKVSNVQKQILKAIGQLIGAKKVLEKGIPIFDSKSVELKFNKVIKPHCIVLVNELIPTGDWKTIENKITQAIIDENIYLNVFDYEEFMKYVMVCSGRKELLEYHLMERTKFFMEHKNVLIKTKIVADNND